MKKLMMKKGSTCMACLECVRACSEAFYKEFDPDKACIQIVEKKSVRPMACPQCGKCAEVCNTCVIQPNPKGVYMLQKKECVGCLMCVGFCPEQVMVQSDKHLEPSKCTACGICVKACPTGAIYMVED